MYLNTIAPGEGAKKSKKRLGRGIGSGLGKTGGKGHKGQKARAGGTVRPGFEGGQQPLYRRLPKFGFTSRIGRVSEEVRLSELNKMEASEVTLAVLKAENVIGAQAKQAKVILSGSIEKAIVLKGIKATAGARAAIEAAGGKVEE
ncbi:MAG: 50S ribosomal protein L15 [Hahellaceae bacterium]|nr:50S ribosomal protein L15 [Hahellaceae bacterium]